MRRILSSDFGHRGLRGLIGYPSPTGRHWFNELSALPQRSEHAESDEAAGGFEPDIGGSRQK
jgi:hypothetical protein